VKAGLKTDALLVAADPTGPMLALCLANVSCHIIDASPTAAPEPRAIGMQARTLELLANAGVAGPFLLE
jgi:2-polyprenyl-6-methoxyphenol hydroxylase-like FAD-dependent oxidoreductase